MCQHTTFFIRTVLSLINITLTKDTMTMSLAWQSLLSTCIIIQQITDMILDIILFNIYMVNKIISKIMSVICWIIIHAQLKVSFSCRQNVSTFIIMKKSRARFLRHNVHLFGLLQKRNSIFVSGTDPISLLILLFLLGAMLLKKPMAPSFQIGRRWNLARLFFK